MDFYYPSNFRDGLISTADLNYKAHSEEHREVVKQRLISWARNEPKMHFIAEQLELESSNTSYIKYFMSYNGCYSFTVYYLEGAKRHGFKGKILDDNQKSISFPNQELWNQETPEWLHNRFREVVESVIAFAKVHPKIGELIVEYRAPKAPSEIDQLIIKIHTPRPATKPNLLLRSALVMEVLTEAHSSHRNITGIEASQIANSRYEVIMSELRNKHLQKKRNTKLKNLILIAMLGFILGNLVAQLN
jgi:hypothetical protein